MTVNTSITAAIRRSIHTFRTHNIEPEKAKLNEADEAAFLREVRDLAYRPQGAADQLPAQFMGVTVEALPREQASGRSIFTGTNSRGHLVVKHPCPDSPAQTDKSPWSVFDWLPGTTSRKV